MGDGGATSGGTFVFTKARKLEMTGKPNSRSDLYKNGRLKQSRWYDYEGKAVRNRNYFHQNPKGDIPFPHDHTWEWINGKGTRSNGHILPPDPNSK